jgi:hypothetical protein
MDGSDWPQTKKYRPSNGTEGMIFEDRFCERCKREAKFRRTEDGADGCPILMKVMAYDVDDEKYPTEWVVNLHDPVGSTARCTAFQFDDPNRRRRPRKPRPAPLLDLVNA